MNTTVSAIVPAFNEEKTIIGVLAALAGSPLINEVICVNDGSIDGTLQEAKKVSGVYTISLKKNSGKGYAISKGIRKAQGKIVLMCDGDLEGLNNRHIKKLPSIGHPKNGVVEPLVDFFRPLSGERAYFKKDLLPYVNLLAEKGYGVELYLNFLFHQKKIKLFDLYGVRHLLKGEKHSLEMILRQYTTESKELLREIFSSDNPIFYLKDAYLKHYIHNLLRK